MRRRPACATLPRGRLTAAPEGLEIQHASDHHVSGRLRARLRFLAGWPLLLLVLGLALAVHWPSLRLGFASDDFQWWQAARMALERPALLLAPYGGFRPANLWTLVADILLWGHHTAGFHLTSILFHLACGAALWLLARRLGLRGVWGAGLVALWLCSPYTLEPAQSVCTRFQPLLLLCWLGMALAWPGPGQGWDRRRLGGVAGLAVLSALSKESWVVLPGFVAAFELFLRRRSPGRALRAALPAAAAAAVYSVVYFIAPPIPATYFGSLSTGLVKIPHSWAVFCGLSSLHPGAMPFGAAEAAATAMLGALAWAAWRFRRPAMGVGLAFFLLPFVPIAAVDFLVPRYTAIPLAGFLLVAADAARWATGRLAGSGRALAGAGVAALAALFLAGGLWWLRGDMADAAARDAVHRELVAEASAVAPRLPRDAAVVAVRAESDNVNATLALAVRGVAKAYYVRRADPYGLADWAALLSWVRDQGGGPLSVRVPAAAAAGRPFVELLHVRGGFRLAASGARSVRDAARLWRGTGAPVTVLVPWPPPAGSGPS